LARDVHSRLLTVREGQVQVGKLEGQLKALMLEAEDFEAGWDA
jgi:hypothetical protein